MSAVETVVAPDIAEPTTPIKPSEALRLGRLLRPRRITGATIQGLDGACALGSIASGAGVLEGYSDLMGRFPEMTSFVDCPVHKRSSGDRVWKQVIHLNDEMHWSDNQIVAWLESMDL